MAITQSFFIASVLNLTTDTSKPHTPHLTPHTSIAHNNSQRPGQGFQRLSAFLQCWKASVLSLYLTLSACPSLSLCLSLSLPSFPPSLSVSLAVSLSHSLPAFVLRKCIRIVSFRTGLRLTETQRYCSARKLHDCKQAW